MFKLGDVNGYQNIIIITLITNISIGITASSILLFVTMAKGLRVWGFGLVGFRVRLGDRGGVEVECSNGLGLGLRDWDVFKDSHLVPV